MRALVSWHTRRHLLTAVALAVAMTVSACATTAGYEKILNSWVGADINALITTWGPPSEQFSMPNGNTMYTWVYIGGTRATAYYLQNLDMTVARANTAWCKTTFTVDGMGRIRMWRWEGNACRASE